MAWRLPTRQPLEVVERSGNSDRSEFQSLADAIIEAAVDDGGVERPVEGRSQLSGEIDSCAHDTARHFLSQLSQHNTMLGVAIADALASLSRLDPELPFSATVLARGLAEAAADLYWLSDLKIGAVERVRRTFLIYLRQHETQVRQIIQYSQRLTADGPGTPDLTTVIEKGWESLRVHAEKMASVGYALKETKKAGFKYSVGTPKPPIRELVDTVMSKFLGKTALNLYSTYSSVAHAEGEGLGSLLQYSDKVETPAGTRYRHGLDDEGWNQRIVLPTNLIAAGSFGTWLKLSQPKHAPQFEAKARQVIDRLGASD